MSQRTKPEYFAILSDIHGNIDALDAVLADISKWPCAGIICLGDIVGYGPAPEQCVERVMEMCAITVMGNHEAMLFMLDHMPVSGFRDTIGRPLQLAREKIPASHLHWLRELPLKADLGPMTLSHASLFEPADFHYLHDAGLVEEHFSVQKTALSFQGHTHVPVIWEKKDGEVACFEPPDGPMHLDVANLHAINVGSVGQPRDQNPRACYALYDVKKKFLLHRRISYDIARARKRFRDAGLPSDNSVRIQMGY